ncbi:hypothetical protein PoB_007044900 [Plakobranchus ocellatus]|uniref:Uncharacterized protein n=1 Tax=Plakobranchus ocellatus TaxID=259542 RepID=A0AAV4DIC7_9GAST|nr:hypothetical protein PoB_007044900 [Plakobranchus ocellatus]
MVFGIAARSSRLCEPVVVVGGCNLNTNSVSSTLQRRQISMCLVIISTTTTTAITTHIRQAGRRSRQKDTTRYFKGEIADSHVLSCQSVVSPLEFKKLTPDRLAGGRDKKIQPVILKATSLIHMCSPVSLSSARLSLKVTVEVARKGKPYARHTNPRGPPILLSLVSPGDADGVTTEKSLRRCA